MNTSSISKLNPGTPLKWLAIAGVVANIAACGGGGSSSGSDFSIAGTVAIGRALSGATVTATCVSGSGSVTANEDGSYSVSIVQGAGPCVLVATKDATVLHSIAPMPGVYNITSLTDLLVDYLATRAGTTTDSLLTNTNGNAILQDPLALTQGQTAVANYVQTTHGVTLSTANFLGASIRALLFPGGEQSETDKDLENLKAANVVGEDGTPTTSVIDAIKTEARKEAPYVAATGAGG